MNLYKVTFSHYSPKDREDGIKGYLIAKNDEEVFNYIDKELNYDTWKDNERDIVNIYDEDYNKIGEETFKQKIIRIKGEQNDEELEINDAYYGVTLFGWELVKKNVENTQFLLDLGIAVKINKQ